MDNLADTKMKSEVVSNDWVSSIREASIYSLEEWSEFKSLLERRIKIYIDQRRDSPQLHQALLACVGTSFIHKFYPEGIEYIIPLLFVII